VFRWLACNEDFRNQYAQARELQQELLYDELFEIADDSKEDYTEINGEMRLNSEHVQRSRLRIDTRKWVMERMASRKYGVKQQIDHTSKDGSMSPSAYTPEQYSTAQSKLSGKMDDLD